jgi:TonB family protein
MSSRWRWALGASLAIHAVLLAAVWRAHSRARLEVPVGIRAPLAVQLWHPPSPSPSPEAALSRPTRLRGRAATLSAPPAVASEDGQIPLEEPDSSEPAEGLPGGSGPRVGGLTGPAGGGRTSAGGAGEGVGVDLIALHLRLAEAAQFCYPPAARRLRLRGQLELAFCAAADGQVVSQSIGSSSGSELLDHAALSCLLERAAPLPVRSGCFRVPVRFGVR